MKVASGYVAGILLALGSGCAAASEQLHIAVQDASGAPVPSAVVYLLGAAPQKADKADDVIIDQQDSQFLPQISVIQTGTEVEFPNNDSVSHHVYSFARPNTFELPLYKGETRPRIRFDYPGIVTLGCNIHDSMLGYLVVVDTPYFGITDADGMLVIEKPVAGSYSSFVWSPRLDPREPLAMQTIMLARDELTTVLQLKVDRQLRSGKPESASGLAWSDY